MGSRRRVAMVAFGLWLTGISQAGCGGQPLMVKEPKELLRLSVSGLAGIDVYRFSGESGVKDGGSMKEVVRFGGQVEHHDQIRLEAASARQIEQYAVRDPMAYLKQVQAEAQRTELEQVESNTRSTVLLIHADPELARNRWVRTLSAKWEDTGQFGAKKLDKNQVSHSLPGKKDVEIRASRNLLEEMVQSLSVDTTYRLVIDRKKLLPGKLTENTVLHYKRAGRPYSESRQLTLEIKPDLRS
ncbi:hypothetical protein ACFFSY_31995 [Paenibacillus aurantiacus]|uniref:Uncharacterized protein n=1 Tax=Paenibacillus aurantiacus TaxID=1936118 RepID=A0ABV5KZD0_9BACL